MGEVRAMNDDLACGSPARHRNGDRAIAGAPSTLSEVVITDVPTKQEIADGERLSVWYFGGDYTRLLALSSPDGTERPLRSTGEAINAVAARIRDEMLE